MAKAFLLGPVPPLPPAVVGEEAMESRVVAILLSISCCSFLWRFPRAGSGTSGTLEGEEVRGGKKCPKGSVIYWKELDSRSQKTFISNPHSATTSPVALDKSLSRPIK